MNKRFRSYAIIWAILLIVFNVVCFAIPSMIEGAVKYDSTFWVAYAFIIVAFIGQLICAHIAFKADNLKKLFYNMPIITISYTGLIIMLIVGALAMSVPGIPAWAGVIVCVLVLAFTAIAVVKASWAASEVERIDEKVAAQTSFIKSLTYEAEGLAARARTPEAKAACKKVYEAIRYSDPMSSDSLNLLEAQITVKLAEFKDALSSAAEDPAAMNTTAEDLLQLIADRNRKCKAEK